MGGEGAMIAASNSLKNNRNLVSKRKDKKALEGSYANAEIKTFPKATEAQLIQIRQRMAVANKKNRFIQYVLIGFVVFLSALSVVFILK